LKEAEINDANLEEANIICRRYNSSYHAHVFHPGRFNNWTEEAEAFGSLRYHTYEGAISC
jgi:hypothetical protein